MEFTDRQTAHILAALRSCQGHDLSHMPHFDEVEPLSDAEIDALADQINCGEATAGCYTVVGMFRQTACEGDLRDASFVEPIQAKGPREAVKIVRMKAARNRAAIPQGMGERAAKKEVKRLASDIVVLAVFEGQLSDLYNPAWGNP